ncbi:MAG: hypothetical protein B6U89_02215 [Desulfurococcales archaeon ex4484_58]|nr:MAG: hypothetical protein B6U89_02215 [Desulfurococcales archaeon ex4484_58]
MESRDLLKNKKLFKVDDRLREKVFSILREELLKEEHILLAIVFGGFLEYKYTRDVDVAVYLSRSADLLEDYIYADKLSRKLTEKTGLPIDIIVLNQVKDPVFNRVLLRGKPLFIRDLRLYYGLKMLAIEQRNRFIKTPQ